MSRPTWETPEGRILYKAEVSHHHVASERRAYRTRLEVLYRNMGGMVVLMANEAHVRLHREVPPPPKPNPYLMADIYHHARLLDYDDQYGLFDQIVGYVGLVANGMKCEQNVHDAQLLYDNLLAQQAFIQQGRLVLRQEAA